MENKNWPELDLKEWQETYDLLHLISQIIGKIKLQFTPFKNHWWNISLLPSVDGLTSGIIPCGKNCVEITLNFINHTIDFKTDDGRTAEINLESGTIAAYYQKIKKTLEQFGLEMKIWPVPVEMEDRTPFDEDNRPREYQPHFAEKFHSINISSANVLEQFRSGFTGKSSPVHFFWGSFDMALTFFNGNPAPEHPGAPNVGKEVMVKSYNEELASFGYWPGKGLGEVAFYAYTYPVIQGLIDFNIEPSAAYFSSELGEFVLPYKAVKDAADPDLQLLTFLKSAYRAVEELGGWNKKLMSKV